MTCLKNITSKTWRVSCWGRSRLFSCTAQKSLNTCLWLLYINIINIVIINAVNGKKNIYPLLVSIIAHIVQCYVDHSNLNCCEEEKFACVLCLKYSLNSYLWHNYIFRLYYILDYILNFQKKIYFRYFREEKSNFMFKKEKNKTLCFKTNYCQHTLHQLCSFLVHLNHAKSG